MTYLRLKISLATLLLVANSVACVGEAPEVPVSDIVDSGTTEADASELDAGTANNADNRDAEASDLGMGDFDADSDMGSTGYRAVYGDESNVAIGVTNDSVTLRCADDKFVTGLDLKSGANPNDTVDRAYITSVSLSCSEYVSSGSSARLLRTTQTQAVNTDETSNVAGERDCNGVLSTGVDVRHINNANEFVLREIRLECGQPMRTSGGTTIADPFNSTFFDDGVCDARALEITTSGGNAQCVTTPLACPFGSGLVGIELNASGNVFIGVNALCAVVNLTAFGP